MIEIVEPSGGRRADVEAAAPESSDRSSHADSLDVDADADSDSDSDADSAPERRIDVFVHIPKAVGTTLRRVLFANAWSSTLRIGNIFKGSGGYEADPKYSRRVDTIRANPSARLITGHVPIAIRDEMPATWRSRWFTIVRDPVERAISHYYEIVGAERDAPSRNDVRPSVLTIGYTRALNGVDYVPDNLHTRMLCGLAQPFGEMTEEHLQMAMANAERLRLVGLAERFDESLALLERRFGYYAISYQPIRVNSTRPRAGDVPEELRLAAQRANQLDSRLYDHVAQLFDGHSELADPMLQVQVEALRRVRRPGADGPPNPPDSFDGDARTWARLVAAHEELILERTARLRAQRQKWTTMRKCHEAMSDLAAARSELERRRDRTARDDEHQQARRASGKTKSRPKRARADRRPPSTPLP